MGSYYHALLVAALGLDPTLFLCFADSRAANNSEGVFSDQSGRGNHFTQTDPALRPVLELDENGIPCYNMEPNPGSGGRYWDASVSTGGESTSCTFYIAIDIQRQGNSYFFDAFGHNALIGNGDLLYYSGGIPPQGAGLLFPTGKHVLVFVLNKTTGIGRVYLNEGLFFEGIFNGFQLGGGRLGSDYTNNLYAPTRGRLYCYAVDTDADSDELRIERTNYLRQRFF